MSFNKQWRHKLTKTKPILTFQEQTEKKEGEVGAEESSRGNRDGGRRMGVKGAGGGEREEKVERGYLRLHHTACQQAAGCNFSYFSGCCGFGIDGIDFCCAA
jgi:hypothetical protein